MKTITVKTGVPYNIFIGKNLFSSPLVLEQIPNKIHKIIIITDDHVAPLYANDLTTLLDKHDYQSHIISITPGEPSKSRTIKAYIEDTMFELGCGRDTCVIALGGGVVTDLAGFVAATFCRGIPALYLPTSLLAMVDAAIGGKTGINTDHGKNLIGAFKQPNAVIIDVASLQTLDNGEFINAFSESIKHALIYDKIFFDFITDNLNSLREKNSDLLIQMITRSCEIKRDIVEIDEQESGLREILNFGHTIAHALESLSNYEISHGQAVAIGIVVESYISMKVGLLDERDFQKIQMMIKDFGIASHISNDFSYKEFTEALGLDKKARYKIPRFVLLTKIGATFSNNNEYAVAVDEDVLQNAVGFLMKKFS